MVKVLYCLQVVVMGPNQKFLTQVGSKSTRVKGKLVSYLLRVKSKLGSGQGPSLPSGPKQRLLKYSSV